MNEKYLARADSYFRRKDTRLARGLQRFAPEVGKEYRTGRKRKIIESSAAVPIGVASAPILGALGVAIKMEDGGPIFYHHRRIGKGGSELDVPKMRSLHPNADQDHQANIDNANATGIPHDRRATRVGRLMRKYHVDELPQFWLVPRGRLSVIGMRATDTVTREVMREARPTDAQNMEKLYEQDPPGMSNLMNVLNEKYYGNVNALYHINMLWARRASLGTSLYFGFRMLVNTLREAKKPNSPQQ